MDTSSIIVCRLSNNTKYKYIYELRNGSVIGSNELWKLEQIVGMTAKDNPLTDIAELDSAKIKKIENK